MDFVAKKKSNLSGIALNEPIYSSDLTPMIVFERIPEPTAAQRHNRHASFMKAKRKEKKAVGMDDDN